MSEQSQPVVVGVDGSQLARTAAVWAAGEARRRGTGVRIVAVVPGGPVAGADWEAFPNDIAADFAAGGREHAEAARSDVAEHDPQLPVTAAVVEGWPAEALVRESRETERLVLGARGMGELGGVVVSSTSEAVVSHAQCPVAVIRREHGAESSGAPVVVGLDGSSYGRAVMAEACAAASARGAEVLALRAWSDIGFHEAGEPVAALWRKRRGGDQEALDEELAPWRTRFPDLAIRAELVRDRPAHALLHRSGRAQLVVVGGRGRGGFPGMQLGSTARVLVHACQCPLLVVPPGAS